MSVDYGKGSIWTHLFFNVMITHVNDAISFEPKNLIKTPTPTRDVILKKN